MSLGKKCLQNTKINIFLLNDVYIILRRKKKSSQTGRKLQTNCCDSWKHMGLDHTRDYGLLQYENFPSPRHKMQAAGGDISWEVLKDEKCPAWEEHFDFIFKDWEVRCTKAQRPGWHLGSVSLNVKHTLPPRLTLPGAPDTHQAGKGCWLLRCASFHLDKWSFSK